MFLHLNDSNFQHFQGPFWIVNHSTGQLLRSNLNDVMVTEYISLLFEKLLTYLRRKCLPKRGKKQLHCMWIMNDSGNELKTFVLFNFHWEAEFEWTWKYTLSSFSDNICICVRSIRIKSFFFRFGLNFSPVNRWQMGIPFECLGSFFPLHFFLASFMLHRKWHFIWSH